MIDRIPAAILVLAMTTSTAFAAPAQLYGKSVIVSWTENRMQTTDISDTPAAKTASGQLSVYVSDKGRAFSRVCMSVDRRRGPRSGQRDAVQGEGSARDISFRGNSMSATMPRGNAGALLVSVTFDSGFQGCSAHVVIGEDRRRTVHTHHQHDHRPSVRFLFGQNQRRELLDTERQRFRQLILRLDHL